MQHAYMAGFRGKLTQPGGKEEEKEKEKRERWTLKLTQTVKY